MKEVIFIFFLIFLCHKVLCNLVAQKVEREVISNQIESINNSAKENAVTDFRTLIGATNPAEAAPGTIRALYAKSIGENAVHGSDSDENAQIEGSFHFGGVEMF